MKQDTDATRPNRSYLPTLDGWRTLSIAAVILCHDRLHNFGSVNTAWLYQDGNLGVDIFFASLFFVRNYTFFFQHFQTVSPFYTSHFWLFAVEEQRPAIRAGHRLVSALALRKEAQRQLQYLA
jgi:peptidoglycan/LPS O-acetylase OafA/YrhL